MHVTNNESLTLNVKNFPHLVRPNIMLNEAPDEEGKWIFSADLDVKIFLQSNNDTSRFNNIFS